MGILVAVATGIVELTGRLLLTGVLAVFFLLYAVLGLSLTVLVWTSLEARRLPRRLVAVSRLTRRRVALARLKRTALRRPSPGG